MAKSPISSPQKRQLDSDKETSSDDEWVGPKQSEIEQHSEESNSVEKSQPVVKKRRSNNQNQFYNL